MFSKKRFANQCGLWNVPIACLLSLSMGCQKKETEQTSAIKKETAVSKKDNAERKKERSIGGAPSEAAGLPPSVLVKDVGFVFPGTAVVDETRDVYLVSNANENPLGTDNNGYISKVSPEGKIIALKWIEGGRDNATLISPKGMAIRKDTLYVADVNAVRKFDVVSGKPKGDIAFEKATHLNDIALSPDGLLYITDTGLTPRSGVLVPSDMDCIYVIDKSDKVSTLVQGEDLKQPNGLIAEKESLYYVSFATNEIFSVSLKGEAHLLTTVPEDLLDGIVRLPDGRLLVTSWRASAIFEGMPEGPFRVLIGGLNSPADLAYDAKRDQIVVPIAREHSLLIQPLGDFSSAPSVAVAPSVS